MKNESKDVNEKVVVKYGCTTIKKRFCSKCEKKECSAEVCPFKGLIDLANELREYEQSQLS